MNCTGSANCTCGCCAGTSVQTPQPRENSPGLSSIPYRVGTWSSFNESMLARLSSSDYPALANLKSRDSDDFTIALLDASAMVLDVLSFYQERVANEGYLRTAQQTRSLTELSRLIGYQPSPGVSASTYVAFTLKAAPGQAPDPTTASITIPQGTQLQSVPPQGQSAQTFETAADIRAKADWNALSAQISVPWIAPGNGASSVASPGSLYLSGTTTQLQVGDSLLILGVDRETWPNPGEAAPGDQWGVVVLTQVRIDTLRNLTYVAWDGPLGVAVPTTTYVTVPGAPTRVTVEMETRSDARFLPRSSAQSERAPPAVEQQVAQRDNAQYYYRGAARDEEYAYYWQRRPVIGMRAVPASDFVTSPWTTAKVFAFRQKASLFGHNAPNANLFVNANGEPTPNGLITVATTGSPPAFSWSNYSIASATEIDLDATYSKIVVGSWFALTTNGAAQLYKVASAQAVSRSDFALSGKVTRLAADYDADPLLAGNSQAFTLPGTEVWLQSEQLTVAAQPLSYPLYGTLLDLQDLRPDLVGQNVVAILGKRQKIAVATEVTGLFFNPDDGTAAVPMNPGDVFTLTDPAPLPLLTGGAFPDWSQATAPLILSVEDANGRTGVIANSQSGVAQASLGDFVLAPSAASDPYVSEYALLSVVQGTPWPYAHTQIQLQAPLANCYERASASVNANVALVTHGQSVSEIMGSGNASTANQSFTLKQSPLTYVQAPTPTGRQSTLKVQVNGLNGTVWTEVGTLYGATASQPVFAILDQSDGTADVLFGDGDEGALLPSGQGNLRADYRIGLGSSGNVGANTLTTLIDRPLGVSAVTNPEAATGGQDAQSLEDVRSSAPLSVLTLGRAVSLSDYENYARTFAGIAKAHALWIPSGPNRGVFLTVAGVGGAALPPSNPTLNNLIASLKNYGNPLIPITVQSFVETLFGFSATIQYDPAFPQPQVTAQVLQTLSAAFGFAQRDFGQGVSVDEISTIIQNVPGVVAVNVDAASLQTVASSFAGDLASVSSGFSVANWNNWLAQLVIGGVPRPAAPAQTIAAYLPVANTQSLPLPAEILVLDPDPSSVVLGVMS
jgi:Baseplate J-like protein